MIRCEMWDKGEMFGTGVIHGFHPILQNGMDVDVVAVVQRDDNGFLCWVPVGCCKIAVPPASIELEGGES